MATQIDRLLEIMEQLRTPETGCPWDLEQTFETIAPYTIEEAYEVADAIERNDLDDLKGELGDLLFQVVFHSQLAKEADSFSFDDVVQAISDKMVSRHPHVFGESDARSAEEQLIDWERIKAAERASKGVNGVLDDVPVGLPAATRALKLQKRAARVGFDWPSEEGVINKIAEEARELEEAARSRDHDDIEDEFGDLLFAMINLGRWLKVDPEKALRRTNAKFVRRFSEIEARLAERHTDPSNSSLEEMEAIWSEIKEQEKHAQKLA
ncbi:MAG: nucleoside triphosphate pyrophosphohydrolase [Pseudomonadota bacterium]